MQIGIADVAVTWVVNRQTLFTVGFCRSGRGPEKIYRFLSVFIGFCRFFCRFFVGFQKIFFISKISFFHTFKIFFFNVYSPENIKRLFEQELTATHTGEPGFRTMDPSKVLNIFRRSDSDHLNKKHIVSKRF